MRKILWAMICGLAAMAAAEQGIAGTITLDGTEVTVGSVDTLIAMKHLENSSDGSETDWVNSVLKPVAVSFTCKIDDLEKEDWHTVSGGATGVFALDLDVYEPGYFLVKTGNIKTTNFSHFLYQNEDSLGWAVIQLAQMGITDIANIEKISHVTLISPAPEPAIVTLLATGVAGLAGVRLRKKK